MVISGIICEYNPLHNGHARHIAETRKLTGADGIVCAMSGNFVQRGDFAAFEKHARAAAAVKCGADLVIELPLPWAVASAETFAFGGVSMLGALGVCTHLSFGSEAGDVNRLLPVAGALSLPEADALIREELVGGISYAKARQRAAHTLIGSDAELLSSPNNLLAVEYLKALRKLKSDMIPVTVARYAADHDSALTSGEYASATLLRRLLQEGSEPWDYMPPEAAEVLKAEITAGRAPVFMSSLEGAILSKLRTMTPEEYALLPDSTEGLYRRLMRAGRGEVTLDGVAEAAKTKRYAMSRIRRMLLCAYLGIKAGDAEGRPPYIKVLAVGEKGRVILQEVSEKCPLPILSKPASVKKLGEDALRLFSLEARATDLYSLAYPSASERTGGREWKTSPYYEKINL